MNLGIYIQVPFCQTKCTYCNFHTGVFAKGLYAPYAAAVCREIREMQELRELTVDTVYLGGGTPSLLAPEDVARMLEEVRAQFRCDWKEVTLEADPETIAPKKARTWRDAGVDRVSLGVQSFGDDELRAAGRMHRRKDIFAAVDFLRDAGFRKISMDLIAGLPHQTQTSWEVSLAEFVAIRPEHVSIYLLEVDDGSRLGKEILRGGAKYSAESVPSDDEMANFYETACARLAAEGYEHYEISNWAQPGFSSRHNLKYWRREPYLGFGAGAHSFDGRRRWANAHEPAEYVRAIETARSPREQEETVTAHDALEEELFLGLRQLAGIDLLRLERQYGAKAGAQLNSRVERLVADGLLAREGSTIRLNPAKLTIANEAFVELLG